jgi:hypothetical protein
LHPYFFYEKKNGTQFAITEIKYRSFSLLLLSHEMLPFTANFKKYQNLMYKHNNSAIFKTAVNHITL